MLTRLPLIDLELDFSRSLKVKSDGAALFPIHDFTFVVNSSINFNSALRYKC